MDRSTGAIAGPPGLTRKADNCDTLWGTFTPWRLLMVVTIAVRLYYLYLTSGQPVWWDEAEYLLKARAIALGTPETGYFAGRPPLFPLMLSAVYAVGLGEATIRMLLAAASVAAVYLTYRIGERLFGSLVGFAGAWMFGLFYVSVFFTMRVMTEIPHVMLVLLGFHLFFEKRRLTKVLGAVALTLATFTRYPAALMVLVVGAHVLGTEGRAAFRNRDYLIAGIAVILVAVPFLAHSHVTYGDALHAWKASRYLMPAMDVGERLGGLRLHYDWARSSLGSVLFLTLAAGFVLLACRAAVAHRWPVSGGVPGSERLVILWALVPLLYFGLLVRPGPDLDRYLITALPAMFLAAGCLVVWAARQVARSGLVSVSAVTVVAMVAAGIPLMARTDLTIRARLESQAELRDAGGWLASRLSSRAVVLSKSVAQLTFYTSHANTELPEERSVFEKMRDAANVDFVVLSAFEEHPPWVSRTAPDALGLRVVARFPDDERPSVVVLAPTGRPLTTNAPTGAAQPRGIAQ